MRTKMRIQDEVASVVKSVLEQHEIRRVIWIAAGGSFGGHWAANYFLQRESRTIPTEMHTSNEFVFATPPYVDEHCLCVLTSMRGTPETAAPPPSPSTSRSPTSRPPATTRSPTRASRSTSPAPSA